MLLIDSKDPAHRKQCKESLTGLICFSLFLSLLQSLSDKELKRCFYEVHSDFQHQKQRELFVPFAGPGTDLYGSNKRNVSTTWLSIMFGVKSARRDSNPCIGVLEAPALPTELRAHVRSRFPLLSEPPTLTDPLLKAQRGHTYELCEPPRIELGIFTLKMLANHQLIHKPCKAYCICERDTCFSLLALTGGNDGT